MATPHQDDSKAGFVAMEVEHRAPIAPDDIDGQLRDIKRRLRATMNGQISHAQRQQGLNYRINFGVDQPRLVEIAQELPHTLPLAVALWKEDVRELRLLAPMLMPHSEADEEMVLLWLETLQRAEEAQVLVFHLLRHLPLASSLAFRLVASERPLLRLVAWLLLGRLFMDKFSPSDRDRDELLDHWHTELSDPEADAELQRTALNALYKYMELSPAAELHGERLLATLTGE